MKTKYILAFIFLSFSLQLLPSEKPLSPEKHFLSLCYSIDVSSVEKFLEQHPTININTKNKYGHTALHLICGQVYRNKKEERQACETIEMLIKKGANPNLRTIITDSTFLHNACNFNNSLLIKMLINNEINVNGLTFLHIPCSQHYYDKEKEKQACEIATILIKKGANPNIHDITDFTPLHYACEYYNDTSSLIKILINNGANTTIGTESATLSPYQMLSKPSITRAKFSSEPILFEPMYAALFDLSNQKNTLATSLLPEIAHIIKNFYLNLCLNDLKAEKWIWEPICIEACKEAYKKDKLKLDNVKNRQQCLARVLFWPKEKKLAINAILHEKEKIK